MVDPIPDLFPSLQNGELDERRKIGKELGLYPVKRPKIDPLFLLMRVVANSASFLVAVAMIYLMWHFAIGKLL